MKDSHFRNPKLTELLTQAVDMKLTVALDLKIEKLFVKFSSEENNQEIPHFGGMFLQDCANLDFVREIKNLISIADKEKRSLIGTITFSSPPMMKIYYDVLPLERDLFFIYLQHQQFEPGNNQLHFFYELSQSLGTMENLHEGVNLLISRLVNYDPTVEIAILLLDEQRKIEYHRFSDVSLHDHSNNLHKFILEPQQWQTISSSLPINLQKGQNSNQLFDGGLQKFSRIAILPILLAGNVFGAYYLFSKTNEPNEVEPFLENFSQPISTILARLRNVQNLGSRTKHMEKILNSVDSFLFIISNHGRPVFYSPSFREILGLSSSDHTLPDILELIEPNQKEKFTEFLDKSTTNFSSEESFVFITASQKRKSLKICVKKIEFEDETLFAFKSSPDQDDVGFDLSVPFQNVYDITAKMPIPVFFVDVLTFDIFLANSFAYELFQYSSEDITKKNFLELFSPSENINLINTVKTSGLKNLEGENFWSMVKKDNSLIKTRLIISNLNFQNKRLLVVILRDVNIEPSTRIIRDIKSDYLVNDEYPLFCKVAPDGILLQANQAYCDLFGKPIDKIVGMPLQGYVYMEDYEYILNHFSQLTSEKRVKKNISRVVNSKGEIKYIEWIDSAEFYEGNLVEISAVGRNITEDFKLDLLRKSMEQRYQALVENLPLVISVFHSQTSTLLYISPQIQKMTGFTQDEFYSNMNKTQELVHPEDWDLFLEYFNSIRIGKNLLPLEFRFINKDGTTGWGEISGSIIELADQTTLIQAFFREVTGRHSAREKLRYYSNFEKLIIEFSLKFINADEETLYLLLSDVIEELGKFMKVDRSYVFDLDHTSKTMSNTFEWCKEGITSVIQDLQGIPFSMIHWWIERLNQNLEIAYDDIEEMPFDSVQQRDLIYSQGIKSLLVVPVFYKGKPQGFIGFDMVEEYTHWEPEAINLLRIVSSLIARTFRKFN